MREIKFQAWDEINKVMRNDVVAVDFENKKVYFANTENRMFGADFREFWDEHFKLIEYTGLKDKNSKEIYEGDIVDYFDYLGDIELANSNVLRVIEYKDEEACFVARLTIGDYSSDKAVYLNEHDF